MIDVRVTSARLYPPAALEAAGAFALVMEMVPGETAGEVTRKLTIPTIGIGAGPECDAQVLVWQDMAGLRTGRMAKFVKQYADVHGVLLDAARAYADDVRSGGFPGPEHSARSARAPRRMRISSRPCSGASARMSAASARPSTSHTKFRHQWMPYER